MADSLCAGGEVWLQPLPGWSWHLTRERWVFEEHTSHHQRVNVNVPDRSNCLPSPCSCGRGRVGVCRAESHCPPGAHLLGGSPGVWPAQRHPWSPGGAANSLGVHQDGGSGRSASVWFSSWGPALAVWGRELRHLERNKLQGNELFLLEAAALLSTCSAEGPHNDTVVIRHCFLLPVYKW